MHTAESFRKITAIHELMGDGRDGGEGPMVDRKIFARKSTESKNNVTSTKRIKSTEIRVKGNKR